ncbi:hypothetical protein, partial [[Eubacterium] cellulosolvens]
MKVGGERLSIAQRGHLSRAVPWRGFRSKRSCQSITIGEKARYGTAPTPGLACEWCACGQAPPLSKNVTSRRSEIG